MKEKNKKSFLSQLKNLFHRHSSLSEQRIMEELEKVDKSDSRNRPHDEHDEWLEQMAPKLHRYASVLRFLNRYGYVSEMYFDALENVTESVEERERALCVRYADTGYLVYPNLFCEYLRRRDLSAEVKKEVFSSDEYKQV